MCTTGLDDRGDALRQAPARGSTIGLDDGGDALRQRPARGSTTNDLDDEVDALRGPKLPHAQRAP